MTTETDRPLFSQRYGINERLGLHQPEWARRHLAPDVPLTHGCICPGSSAERSTRCQQSCTEEDRLCDECRTWCYAVDVAGRRFPFWTLHGGAR